VTEKAGCANRDRERKHGMEENGGHNQVHDVSVLISNIAIRALEHSIYKDKPNSIAYSLASA